MKFTKRDAYLLSTGTAFYANRGLLSPFQEEDESWTIHEGYDGLVAMAWQIEPPATPGDELYIRFTRAEVREMADYMIQRWCALRDYYKDEDDG